MNNARKKDECDDQAAIACYGDVCTPTPTSTKEALGDLKLVDVKNNDLSSDPKEADADGSTPDITKKPSKNTSTTLPKIHSQQDLDRLKDSNDTTMLMVEYITTWCGACKGIAPRLEELAKLHADSDGGGVAVYQVYCDSKNKETKKLVAAMGISSYPVFVVYSNGTQVQKWNGADIGKLEGAFKKYAGGGESKRGGGGKGRKKKGKR